MFTVKQIRVLALSLLVASVGAMGIVAGAAMAGVSGDGLAAMSTVLSTGFAAIAVVVSLGMAEPGRDASGEASDARTGESGRSVSIRADETEGRIDVDVLTGHVRLVLGGVTISMVFQADRIGIAGGLPAGSSDGH